MKKKRFNEAKIMHILKQAESGIPALDLCREHGMSSARYIDKGFLSRLFT